MEIHQVADWHFLHHNRTGVWIAEIRDKLSALVLAQNVVKSHADLLVNSNIKQLRVVILNLNLLCNHINRLLQRLYLTLDILFYLRLSQSLTIQDDKIGNCLRILVIILSPVLKYWIKSSLWNLFLFLYTHDSFGVYLSACLVNSTYKS